MIKSTLMFTAALLLLGVAAPARAGEGCCPHASAKPALMKGQARAPRPHLDLAPGAMILRHFERVQPPLTDTQKEQIKKLAEETRAKMQAAQSPEERRAIHMDMRKTITTTILTEQQRASLRPRGKGPGMASGMHKAPLPPAQGTHPAPPPSAE